MLAEVVRTEEGVKEIMEHLIQLSIAMDDKTIAKQVEDSLVKKLHNDIYGEYFKSGWNNDSRIESICHQEVQEFIKVNREEIITKAVEQIKKSVLKTNAFKEKLEDIT
jgi:ribonuclease HII